MTDRSESRQAGGQSGVTGGAGPDTNGQITGQTIGQTIGQIIGRNLLLIEDEANIAEAIRFILSRDGWDVRLHADGADAMAKLRALRPDVVILDLMLPGRSGLEILAEMRADPDLARTPVLMLTARGQDRDREAAARAGATRFLAKPFANADLVVCLRDMAAGASEGVGGAEDGAAQSTAVENRFVKDAS